MDCEQQTIENLEPVNGRVLLYMTVSKGIFDKHYHNGICEVVKVAKNVNYEGSPKRIEVGDKVTIDPYKRWEYQIHWAVGVEGKHFLAPPNIITGVFKKGEVPHE